MNPELHNSHPLVLNTQDIFADIFSLSIIRKPDFEKDLYGNGQASAIIVREMLAGL